MQRYFIELDNWKENSILITGDDVHHIARVMRMTEGDELVCVHPSMGAAVCEIKEVRGDQVRCEIVEWEHEDREMPVKVTIVQSLGKGDKMEQVVQKGTELGANQFISFQAKRSVVKWDEKKASKKLQRLEKIAKEASEQSERSHIPQVQHASSLQEILETAKDYTLCLIAYEDEARQNSCQTLARELQKVRDGDEILIIFGPEGGFADEEVEELKNHNFSPVRLGPRILRMETAPLYFLSSLSYQLEEMPE
ncbi:16S rRNA (uracil(1498)-N(3))-methyltransferase [Halobacillus yeomjeoni]|uniref:16S rRNA (uracil(1498)-N(3))-methyltransferase n=1 Tax=Halobacillus yeomjeoni TaxID=311194 RepID=UPI001CD5AE31|nr:16S rRNA (uracil(1498)-N(3))-methyltransferase [Halobacillus yeomjeoni]MCA0982700.1 16S rRNA (uracil(1498)-N(3))-methyltransferase [Halobacillus yeomjeoni]